MAFQIATEDRNAQLSALVTQAGASATMRFYTGSRLTPAAWTPGTPLATLTYGTSITAANGGTAGGVTGGVLTFGGFTQIAGNHGTGTPTWAALVTSADRCIATIDMGSGTSSIAWTGAVVTGQSVTGTLTLTASNA